MKLGLKIERLEELRALIVSIPEARVGLSNVQTDFDGIDVSPDRADEIGLCGSIVCIAGAAWLHPPFILAGIREIAAGNERMYAAEVFFDAPESLFDGRWQYENDERSDKEVALNRIDEELEGLRELV